MAGPSRRGFLAGLSVLAVAPALVACGDEPTASPGASGGASGDQGAFPATVTHKFGSTTVTEAPRRVVCVGLVEQDALLALGIVPVATTKWFGEAPGGIFSWAADELGDAAPPTVLDATNGIPVEKVAALAPDLILGLYSGMTEAEYGLLSKIAPTVAQPDGYVDYGTPWDESTLLIGAAVGRAEAARSVVDAVNARIEQEAADHPEFAGRSAVVVTSWEGLFVYGPEDPRGRMLAQLGFTFPEALLDEDSKEFGWSLSAENTGDLDGLDTVVWLDLAAADEGITGLWEKTSTRREGRYLDLSDADGDYYVAHSMVTPLSIPYVLDRYVPQLAAAVDGDPATEPPASAA
jgi:iron complex transport system substrate-binding protein